MSYEDEDFIAVEDLELLVGTVGQTMIQFIGTDQATGERVMFGADHRPGAAIIAAMEAGESPVASVPEWAVISREAS